MKKFLGLLVFSLLMITHQKTIAQTASDTTIHYGKVTVIEDPVIDWLMEQHKNLPPEKKTAPGFRIQIASNNNKQLVLNTKAQFIKSFPDVPSYFNYYQPNYRLRIGDYRSKLEANQALKDIKRVFPAAFIVNDEINLAQDQ